MAITFLQEKKRQKYLILILALIIIAILIIVWQGFLRREAPLSPAVSLPLTHQKIFIDWPTLEDVRVSELQAFEAILPLEGEVGRENPFIPY